MFAHLETLLRICVEFHQDHTLLGNTLLLLIGMFLLVALNLGIVTMVQKERDKEIVHPQA
jgi:hypothetical protein